MSSRTELNGKTEGGYAPLVELDDDIEFDDGEISPDDHPIKRALKRGKSYKHIHCWHDLTR